MLTSTSAWSFQREEVFLMSKAILFATSYKVHKEIYKEKNKTKQTFHQLRCSAPFHLLCFEKEMEV